jgi:hypothetical protein
MARDPLDQRELIVTRHQGEGAVDHRGAEQW